MKSNFFSTPLVISLLLLTGCGGYTTKSVLPDNIKTIHVMPVKNAINLATEVSDQESFRVTRPGLEVELTNAIINRFIFDGNLKVVMPDKANAVVEATLIDYRRDALRYTESDDVQEYRLSVTMNVVLRQTTDNKVIWQQDNLVGDTTFFLSGSHATSEDEAVVKAVDDAARRVVEKTIEIW